MAKKVLIVDDEPDVVTYLSAVLADNGFEAISACNGEEALEKVRQEHPSLITLDITMPEMSGVKAYRTLKEDAGFKAIPVVIVTGISHEFKRFISTREHVPAPEGYLEKPVNPEDLLAEVRRLLA